MKATLCAVTPGLSLGRTLVKVQETHGQREEMLRQEKEQWVAQLLWQ